jgi:diaminopimelate decarboxylase
MTGSILAGAKAHHFPAGYPVVEGELMIAGQSAKTWVEAHGSPLFLYDRSLMTVTLEATRAALPEGVEIHYAMKANPHPGVVAHMAAISDGLDIASGGELRLALAAGADPAQISFAGPGKRREEIDAGLAAGVLFNVESATEVERVRARAAALGRPARVAVRVNPAFEMRGAGMRMGGRPQPFGIDEADVPAVLALLGEAPFQFEGFHVYLGSQTLSASAVTEAQEKTLAMLARLSAQAPQPPKLLNIGGGFGIPYFPGDLPLDIVAVGEGLKAALQTWRPQLFGARIVTELGRYLVGEAGVYLTRIIDRKTSYGEIFLVTDGGLHHQLAASGNFGQVLRRNYPVALASRMSHNGTVDETVTVVGCLCTPLDRLAERCVLPTSEIGDVVAVFQAGAYGASASPAGFLSHPGAAEIVV